VSPKVKSRARPTSFSAAFPERPEGDDLRDVVLAVLPADVLDHLVAPLSKSTSMSGIDLRSGFRKRSKKPVADRVEVGDAERPGDDAPAADPRPGPTGIPAPSPTG
jgi:hypothetical protein